MLLIERESAIARSGFIDIVETGIDLLFAIARCP